MEKMFKIVKRACSANRYSRVYQHDPKIFDFAPKSHKDTKYSL